MTANTPPTRSTPDSDWQVWGELELPVKVSADDAIHAWLAEILEPLRLPADFRERVLRSAQDAAARLMQVETILKHEHIHLKVFVPEDRASRAQTWGFFRIEKIENGAGNDGPTDHAIEFYLYIEG